MCSADARHVRACKRVVLACVAVAVEACVAVVAAAALVAEVLEAEVLEVQDSKYITTNFFIFKR
jgi:hypothetical protein